ncbi:CoA transferase [Algiphilus sp. W345]|uniref:CoA transferase n=1 Tax=Banduia mediterranea TaxID=3075609 RepID=A0ABU2WFU9_9GAMM|nr:CoA transferase [Algiphilus sp. W345]MDT0496164.1 CoA transferase [Algiphilus sp. W345]
MGWPPFPVRGGSLSGLKVLDLSRVLGGPYCTQILSDHGADVIKVEPPGGDETRTWGPPFVDGTASYFIGVNRNKRDIALDLSKPQGREVVLRLLAEADVLVENFKTGTMEKWGLGYEAMLRDRFPRLIYCRVSGFGADGPLGGAPGYDAVAQAIGGLMSINGDPASGPTRIGIPIVDMATGLNAVIGILLALAERQRSGVGQFVDTTLFDTAVGLLHPHAANWFVNGQVPALVGSGHPNVVPYDKFSTRSGDIFLGIGNDGQFRKFCEFVGVPELATDPRYVGNAQRNRNRETLRASIEGLLAQHDAAALCESLLKAGVPAGSVNQLPQVLEHPHTRHREMVVALEGGQRGLGVPVKLSRTPGKAQAAAPSLGQHTREVLAALEYSPTQIDGLIDARIALCGTP